MYSLFVQPDKSILHLFQQQIVALANSLEAMTQSQQAMQEQINQLKGVHQTRPYMHNSPFSLIDNPVEASEQVYGFNGRAENSEEQVYKQFEDLFRGPAERVVRGQMPYLPLLRDTEPVLDVGCGRGEFLQLLKKNGITAQGVDMDPGMVQDCISQGLDVEQGDACQYLRGLEDNSLGAVFAAHVIEHMPYDQFKEFLQLSLQKLRPGGLWIAETINPHVPTSLKCFWVDLTHQHPMFPEVTLSYAWTAGFDQGYLFFPTGIGEPMIDIIEADAYAVVARKAG